MKPFPAALGLTSEQTEEVVRAASRAPSLHNSQPWRFSLSPRAIGVHADLDRRLPAADPEDRELRLACGAALFNLRLALEHEGLRPSVTIPSSGEHPTLLATVRSTGTARTHPERDRLFRAIATRRTNRRPFLPSPVPAPDRHALVGAVEAERCRLLVVGREQRGQLVHLVHRAHEVQSADESFRAEFEHWTGRHAEDREGVPLSAAGPPREPQDEWVLRDFSAGQSPPRTPGKDFEDDPLTVVLCSDDHGRAADIQAGQALERMLLTATARGLAASLLSQVVEVPETRDELRRALGGRLEPQALLRLGYGSPVPETPRREPIDLLIEDERRELELGPQSS